jgi:peptidoglycan/LPS O-acetylase OafA/YrhL
VRIARFVPFYFLGLFFGCLLGIATILTNSGSWADLGKSLFWGALFLPDFSQDASKDIFPLNVPAWSLFYELIVNFA